MERSSKGIAWPDVISEVTRRATKPCWPSMHRWSRFHFASLYRMARSIRTRP
jgi:hypothetical protein